MFIGVCGLPDQYKNGSSQKTEYCTKYLTNLFIFNIFFFKFLILPTSLPGQRPPAKIAARWRYGPPMTNLKVHYNSQFFLIFHFCIDQEDRRRL